MSKGSVVKVLFVLSWVMWWKEVLPESFLMSLHIWEEDTGWFMPVTNELHDRFFAVWTRTLAFARAFL